jgi:hypothetical protein
MTALLDENAERVESVLDEKAQLIERLQLLAAHLLRQAQSHPPDSSLPGPPLISSADTPCVTCACCVQWRSRCHVAESERGILAQSVHRLRERVSQQSARIDALQSQIKRSSGRLGKWVCDGHVLLRQTYMHALSSCD